MSAPQNAEQIVQRAFELGLIDQHQAEAVWGEVGSQEPDPEEVGNFLLRRELLTGYQLERLKRGDRHGYFYGDYKTLYLVGSGTFARVYRAQHRESGKMVAVKVLRSRYSEDFDQTEQFRREGEMGASLRHPNIVPIYEVFSKKHLHYMVMDFVEGTSLRDFIQVRKQLEPAEAVRLTKEIVAGLAYAYDRGVTHRDLKLSNVLISTTGRAKLVDFGLAAASSSEMSDLEMAECANARTIDYAGLERLTGVRKDDSRSDIYFTGCIFYHMLAGEAPLFETRDRLQRLSASRFRDVAPITQHVPKLPAAVAKVLNKSMDLDVERRYQTQHEFLADLEKIGERLESGPAAAAVDGQAKPESSEGTGRTLMVVESQEAMQNLLRDRLREHGYKVLVVSNPRRALERFPEDAGMPRPADCVIFSAIHLGADAVAAFNDMARRESTRTTPAILLLDARQEALLGAAQTSPLAISLSMPLKMRELRTSLLGLFDLAAKQSDRA